MAIDPDALDGALLADEEPAFTAEKCVAAVLAETWAATARSVGVEAAPSSMDEVTTQTRAIPPAETPLPLPPAPVALVPLPPEPIAKRPREKTAVPRRRTRARLQLALLVALPLALLVVAGVVSRRPRPSPRRADLSIAQAARERVTPLLLVTPAAATAGNSNAMPPFEVRFPGSFSFNDVSPTVDVAAVDALVSLIRARCGAAAIAVTGHTCNRGEPDVNVAIGRARADRVAGLLAGAGLDGSRIHADSAGSREPLASNLTSDGRRLNRRVVIRCPR